MSHKGLSPREQQCQALWLVEKPGFRKRARSKGFGLRSQVHRSRRESLGKHQRLGPKDDGPPSLGDNPSHSTACSNRPWRRHTDRAASMHSPTPPGPPSGVKGLPSTACPRSPHPAAGWRVGGNATFPRPPRPGS